MHAKDKPTLEFLPGGFTASPMQQFQTSSDAITCLCRCNISYPERGGEITLITESVAFKELFFSFSNSGKVTEENKICNFLV